MRRFLRYFFGILLAALGVALAVSAASEIRQPYSPAVEAYMPAFFATISLLSAFFLLRRA